MDRITVSPADAILAAVTGVIAAIAVFPLSLLALIVFAIGMWIIALSRFRNRCTRLAITNSIAATLIFGGILAVAALYHPAKIVDQQLACKINLPSTEMTLAELSYAATYDRRSFPIRTSFCFADDDKNIVIRWPQKDLTVGEFLDGIESQTVLRRRFMHCGNGYTVLGGGDCCFGLYVRDPELAVPPFPRDRFDVDAYAAHRDGRITKP